MINKNKLSSLVAFASLLICANAYALPFNIVPDGTLPTTVPLDGTVDAAYTVTNNTRQTRTGNFVKYLPPNVTQDTSTGCGATFNLASGASCILNLVVSGAVDGNDPNPQDHLFVCMSDGTTCAGTNFPLNVTVSPIPPANNGAFLGAACATSSNMCITGGIYLSEVDGKHYPIMAATTNFSLGTWTYPISRTSQLPPLYTDEGSFNSMYCEGTTCIAGGTYQSVTAKRDATIFPLLAYSTDGSAATWNYAIYNSSPTLPTDYDGDGVFNSVNTSNSPGIIFVAAGSYNNGTFQYPMLASSATAGSGWTYVVSSANPPDSLNYSGNGEFLDVFCPSSVLCLAGGTYHGASSTAYPLLARWVSSGPTLTYVVDSTNLPTGFTGSGIFNGVGGISTRVLAGGSYESGKGQQSPMLAMNLNGGGSWTYQIQSGSNLPTDYANNGVFETVSCSPNVCVAGGQYAPAKGGTQPMVAQSTDTGTGSPTWTYPIDSTNVPTDYQNDGIFYTASCSAALCAVGGSYNNGTTSFPMLASTTNSGTSWTYIVTSSSHLPPDYSSDGVFNAINCYAGNHCVASGQYVATDAKFHPMTLVLVSGTWAYQIDSTSSLPTFDHPKAPTLSQN